MPDPSAEHSPALGSPGPDARGALAALMSANVRFWPTVAPLLGRELGRWAAPARAIADPQLRALAEQKLHEERFNAEVAATLATLAPARVRGTVTRAIVALEVLFDYLDGRTELPAADPIAEGERLYAPFTALLDGEQPAPGRRRVEGREGDEHADADEGYILALCERIGEELRSLPAIGAVREVARAALARCAHAQTRLHAAGALGDRQLEDWAREQAAPSGLGWREFTGGCASSVLSVHALIGAAAEEGTSAEDARAIDGAYLAIGGVITTLDSLVDERCDRARGEQGFTRLFVSERELSDRLIELTREARARARVAPHGAHHVMTLAGVIAYYTTHPGAREGRARRIALSLRRELSPTIWPTLAVMSGWRAAKLARTFICASAGEPAGSRTLAQDVE